MLKVVQELLQIPEFVDSNIASSISILELYPWYLCSVTSLP